MLISALTALKGGAWTLDEVQSELQLLFDKQYILTETVETEIRYRPETRHDEDLSLIHIYSRCHSGVRDDFGADSARHRSQ